MGDARELVLLVEDNRADARLIEILFAEAGDTGFRLERVERLDEAAARVREGGVRAALLDLGLPDSTGRDTLLALQCVAPSLPIVVLTGLDDDQVASEAVRLGAQDYLVKGRVDALSLVRSLRYAIERQKRIDAERRLADTESRYHLLFEQSPDATIVIDLETLRPLQANAAACRQFGLATNGSGAACVAEHVMGGPCAEVGRRVRAAVAAGERSFEVTYRDGSGTLRCIEASVRPVDADGRPAALTICRDITARRLGEELHRVRERLLDFAADHTLDELLQRTLDEVCALVDSPIGFYHFVDEDQQALTLQAWSTRTVKEFCRTEGKGHHYGIDEAGVWVDCVREGRPVVHNDYASLPHRKGLPEGHAPVIRELVVPILRRERLVAILGVGNKPQDYTDEDVEVVSFLADVAWEIAERKRGEESLRESEERFRRIYEESPVGYQSLDAEARILDVNPAWLSLLGYAREEVIRRHLREFLAPATQLFFAEHLARFRERGVTHGAEFEVLHRDGSVRTIVFDGVFVRDAQGMPHHTHCVLHDITDRKQAEDQLRRSEEALSRAQRVSHTGSWLWHVPANRLEWSDEMFGIFGVDQESFTGDLAEMVARCIHPDDRAAVERSNLSVLRDGKPIPLEYRVVRSDGSVRVVWAEAGELVRDGNGAPLALTGIVQDITDRKRAEESLARQAAIIDAMPYLVATIRADGRMLTLNPAGRRLVGLAEDFDVEGRRWPEFLSAAASEQMRGETESALQEAGVWSGETALLDAWGEEIAVEMVVLAHGDRAGQQEFRSVIASDIRERVRLNAELRQAQKMEAVGRLAGGIAHDFNNLLTPILTYGQLLLDHVGFDPRLRRYAEQIVRTVDRAAALPRQLLIFSRRQVTEPAVLDLNVVVSDMSRMLERSLGEDVAIEGLPGPGLWPVKADLSQIEQVILNLAVNARDAMPEGGRFTVETANTVIDPDYAQLHPGVMPGDYVLLAAADTGCGMSKEVREHIFEPFFTTKEDGKGTGLGLATVYGIVTQSGGFIRVYSEVGHGTTFRIYLPRTAADAAPTETVADTMPAGGNETILVVEDDDFVRASVCEMLVELGYRVLRADGGEAAVTLLNNHEGAVDLLLTDVIMPGMNGKQVAERIVAARPTVRVVYMSGYTENAVVHHGVLDPGIALLQKPFSVGALARKLREVLDGRA